MTLYTEELWQQTLACEGTEELQDICTRVPFLYPSYNWGERSEPHTCGENGKLSIYMYIYMYNICIYIYVYICIIYVYICIIYMYIYVWYVRIPYMYTSCPICARCNISTLHAGSCNHCCSILTRDKTSRKERMNVETSVTGT